MEDFDSDLIVPPPDWLFKLALDVREIVRSPLGMERFREMLRLWTEDVEKWYEIASEAGVKEIPGESLPYGNGIELIPFPDRPLFLTEKYAVLSALHDNCCKGEKINPWVGCSFPPPPELRRYTVLCCLFHAPSRSGYLGAGKFIVPESDEYLFREFVAEVGSDVRSFERSESAPLDGSDKISEPKIKQPVPKILVSLEPPQIVINGTPIALKSDVDAQFVKALVEKNGQWISGPELTRQFVVFEGVRLDRRFRGLPKQVSRLIESKAPKGYRWKVEEMA